MNQPAIPDPQAAYDHLFENVHARVFFHKLAAAGYAPRTQEEAQYMLDTAGKLREVAASANVKSASAQDNPYYQLNAHLDGVMESYGLNGRFKQAAHQEAEIGIRKAAAEIAGDPNIYNSVLSLKAHEAQQVKAEYDAWRQQRAA